MSKAFALVLLSLGLGAGPAAATLIDTVNQSDITLAGRFAAGPTIAPADLITAMGNLFDATKAGTSAAGSGGARGDQTEFLQPDLTGGYIFPVGRHDALSPSVAAADAAGITGAGTRIRGRVIASNAVPADDADGAAPGGAPDKRSSRDSIRISATSPADPLSAAAIGGKPYNAAINLTALQAWRDAHQPHDTSDSVSDPVQTYPVLLDTGVRGRPVTGKTEVASPVVFSGSYGVLTSSLMAFTNNSEGLVIIGQNFNGLRSLDLPEPSALALLAPGLAVLGAARRRKRSAA